MDVATPTVAEKGHPLPLCRQVRMEGYKRSLQWKSAMEVCNGYRESHDHVTEQEHQACRGGRA